MEDKCRISNRGQLQGVDVQLWGGGGGRVQGPITRRRQNQHAAKATPGHELRDIHWKSGRREMHAGRR